MVMSAARETLCKIEVALVDASAPPQAATRDTAKAGQRERVRDLGVFCIRQNSSLTLLCLFVYLVPL